MDPLSHILESFHVQGGFFLDAEFTAPWCIFSSYGLGAASERVGGVDHALYFHFITEGACNIRLADGSTRFQAKAGDLILFRDGEDHLMGSDLQLVPRDYSRQGLDALCSKSVFHLHEGGGGELTRFVCGYFSCAKSVCRPLLESLPAVVRIPVGTGPTASMFGELLRVGVSESSSTRAGAGSMLSKLAELLFIEAIRRFVENLPEEGRGWLAGLRDMQIGRVLTLLHCDPGRNWTVDELAREVSLSRSALAQRFSAVVGTSPGQYLIRLRLGLAARELRCSREPITRIAQRIGYDSEAAFNRAFKREFGAPPSAWRRAVAAGGRLPDAAEQDV